MNNTRKWIFRTGTMLVLLMIAAAMFVIGRGHTVYIDNKTLEYNGQTAEAYQRVEVYVGEERLSKLAKRERTMADVIGQSFSMRLLITREKGDEPVEKTVTISLPYSWDGIVVNVPAYLSEMPQEAWMTEFVPLATEMTGTEEEEVIPGEEDTALMGDF